MENLNSNKAISPATKDAAIRFSFLMVINAYIQKDNQGGTSPKTLSEIQYFFKWLYLLSKNSNTNKPIHFLKGNFMEKQKIETKIPPGVSQKFCSPLSPTILFFMWFWLRKYLLYIVHANKLKQCFFGQKIHNYSM